MAHTQHGPMEKFLIDAQAGRVEELSRRVSFWLNSASGITPFYCGCGMRKEKQTYWESRRRRHGITILSKNLMSLRIYPN